MNRTTRLLTIVVVGLLLTASGTAVRLLAPRLAKPPLPVAISGQDWPYTEWGRRESMLNDASVVLAAGGMLVLALAMHSWTLPRERDH